MPPAWFARSLPIEFGQQVRVSAEGWPQTTAGESGTGTEIWHNRRLFEDVQCRKDEELCDPVTLFSVPNVEYGSYELNITMDNPWAPFCPTYADAVYAQAR